MTDKELDPSYPIAGLIGIGMGIIHGVVLWGSVTSFSLASFILYKDRMLLPIATTVIIDVVMVLTVLTYPYWMSAVERKMESFVERTRDEYNNQDDEDE